MYQQLKQFEVTVNSMRALAYADGQSAAGRQAYEALRREVKHSQHVLKDYELSGLNLDVMAQAKLQPQAIKSLERLRTDLLKASEYEVVGAVDVAQLSAQLDELIDGLRRPPQQGDGSD